MLARIVLARIILSRIGSCACVFALVGCASGSPATESPSSSSQSTRTESTGTQASEGSSTDQEAGSPNNLPDFQLETLDGRTVALSDYVGKDVVLIDFWATFCDPCLVAMPHLNELYEKYKGRGFVILGVSIDGPNSMGRVRSEVRKAKVTFPILLDPETEALSLYNPKTSAPFSVLIDRKGRIIKKKEGFTPTDVPQLEQAIVEAL